MQISLMKVFYGADSLPYKDVERTVHYPIVGNAFMGASNTTKIRFYVDRIGGSAFQWVVIGKLPNGKRIFTPIESSPQEDTELGEENYIEFSLTSTFTQCKGDLMLSLGGYTGMQELEDGVILEVEGSPVIEKTGAIKVNIAYSTEIAGGDNEEIQTWLEFLSVLGTKAYKDKVIITYQTFAAMNSDLENYDTTQYFFCEETKTIYKLDSGTMTVVTTFDRIGLIIRSDVFSNSSGLSEPNLVEAKKKYCLMLYTAVSPREMYIKVSGVSSSETETTIKFVKLDDLVELNNVTKTWQRKYKAYTFNASNGSLVSSVETTINSYTKSGADYYFANLFTDNVFEYAPQTNETINDDTSGTKFVNKNYVVGKVNAINTSIGNVNENVGKIIGVMPNGNIPVGETLATEDFVNSTVNSLAAFYITKNAQGDPFATYAELASATTFYCGGVVRVPTRNDYCLVNSDENHDNASCRYIYQNGQWEFQFVVNETAFTAEQLAALNSGITATLVSQIGTNQTNIATINAKLPRIKGFVVATTDWQLVNGKYVAELSAGNDFVINDNDVKIYSNDSVDDQMIKDAYGINVSSDATTQKFTFTCTRGDSAPDENVNFTITMIGGN